MTSNTVRRAMWSAALGVGWLTTAAVAAQHDNQAAAPAGSGQTAAGGMKGMQGMQGMQGMACMGGAAQMRTLVEGLSAEVEKARQANDPAAMRTALASVQAGLTTIREHMAGCAAHMSKMGASPVDGGGDHSAHGAAPSASPADHAGHDASAPTAQPIQAAQTNAAEPKAAWTITITPTGYEPADILVKPGVKATLTFIRTTESTCATEVVFPDFDIEKPLPLNQPVVVEITPTKTGEFRFTCGMNMYDGKMVVR